MILKKKRAKGTKKCVIKPILRFKHYTNSLFKNKPILMSQRRLKSDHQIVYTEKINKVAISSNDDKKIQTFDGVVTYSYGTNAFKACEIELLSKIFKTIINNKY